MIHQQLLFLLTSWLVSCACGSTEDSAGIMESMIQPITIASSAVVNLAPTGNYLVVDPITGLLKGRYDAVAGLADGRAPEAGFVIVDSPTGNLVAVIDPAGRAVDVSAEPASHALMVLIDASRINVDRQIQQALNRRQLSASNASALRGELDRIAADSMVSTAPGSALPYCKALVVASDLSALAQRMSLQTEAVPAISTYFVSVDKKVTMVDRVSFRKLQLLRRINDDYQHRLLSAEHVARLKAQLDEVSLLETRYRKHGEVSASQSRALLIMLDQVESSFGDDVAIINDRHARIGGPVN